MSDDDGFDFPSMAGSRSTNLTNLFGQTEDKTSRTSSVSRNAYVAPKQPKKETAVRMMFANAVQAFTYVDDNWASKGKLGVALFSSDVGTYQMIIYQTKNQVLTSINLKKDSKFEAQTNNYLLFKDDLGENWSIMFEKKELLVNFLSQIILIKGLLSSMKFEFLLEEISKGEGSSVNTNDTVEIKLHRSILSDDGTWKAQDNDEFQLVKLKIGKEMFGKIFDESIKGLKKQGHRLILIGKVLFNVELVRVKRDSNPNPIVEEQQSEKRNMTMDIESTEFDSKRFFEPEEKRNPMVDRIKGMGGVSLLGNNFSGQNQFQQVNTRETNHFREENFQPSENPQTRQMTPNNQQFVAANFLPNQAMIHPMQHQNSFVQQQNQFQEFYSQQGVPLNQQNFSPSWSTNRPTIQDQQFFSNTNPNDQRQILLRLNEKMDLLTEKIDSKNSYSNMETATLLSNIQRIVKENENMKKDLFDRTSKIDELNGKISELIEKNQRLVEQTHQTAERSFGVVNNVSEQTAQKILELEKQKIELTNELSQTTSKLSELKLQVHQASQSQTDFQSKINELKNEVEEKKQSIERAETERAELKSRFDSLQEQFKQEKSHRIKLHNQLNSFEEEINEKNLLLANLEKEKNERRTKHENERKRWQNDFDEQKSILENEIDELRSKLRRQRNNDQQVNNIESELQQQFQEKIDKQKKQFELAVSNKDKQIQELQSDIEQLNSQHQQDQEQIDKLEQLVSRVKEKYLELKNDQQQTVEDEIKRSLAFLVQRLKRKIRPNKQTTGANFLSKTLAIMKKSIVKFLSSDEQTDEEDSSASDQSEEPDDQTNIIQSTLQTNDLQTTSQEQIVEQIPLKSEVDFVQEEEPPSTDQVDLDQSQQTEKENLVEQHSEDELETNDPLSTSHHDQNEIDDSPSTRTDPQEESQLEDKLADPLSANTEIRQETEEADATIDPSPQEQKSSNTSLSNSKNRPKQSIPLMNIADDDSEDDLFK